MTTQRLAKEIGQLHAELCAALADPRRLQILYALAGEDLTVSQLTQILGLSQPTTSRHLKILRSRGLVRATRQGQFVVYALTDHRVISALETLRTVLHENLQRRAQVVANTPLKTPLDA